MRRLLISAAVSLLLVLVAAPAQAAAALRFRACDAFGFSCARLSVPLDHSGDVPGRVSLLVKRYPSRVSPSRGVLVAFAGGPGQSATDAFRGDGSGSIIAAARSRDLIVFDQRGSGRSGLLRCRRLERADILQARDAAAECAQRLGPRRHLYRSRDTADDVDALRRRLGVGKLSLYGVSYGTRTALAYALRYPHRVERMVLESVIEEDGSDAFYRTTFAAIPRVLRDLCRRACSFTANPSADLHALVTCIARARLRGVVVNGRGRRRRVSMDRFDLFTVLVAGDFEVSMRTAFPGAVRAALRGDPTPLLRLKVRAVALENAPADPRAFSTALYAATSCEESMLPWVRGAPLSARPAQAAARAAALPDSVFRPFDRATALSSDLIRLCERWPESSASPVPGPRPLPDVPTLLIQGADDLRTPVESARPVARQLPHSQLLVLPGVGHAPLSIDPTGCLARGYTSFLNGGRLPSRCRGVRRPRPTPPPPLSLRAVRPLRGVAGMPGRTLRALTLTLRDVRTGPGSVAETAEGFRGGGLRGGRYLLDRDDALTLRRFSFVPGLRVSGRIERFLGPRRRGRVRIDGPLRASGMLRIRGRRFSGRVGGRRVRGALDPGAVAPSRTALAPPRPVGRAR